MMWPLTVATIRSMTSPARAREGASTLKNSDSATMDNAFFIRRRTKHLEASERLTDAEKQIEVAQALRL